MMKFIKNALKLQRLVTENEWAASELVFMIISKDSERKLKKIDDELGWMHSLFIHITMLINENKELKKQLEELKQKNQ